MKYGKKFTRGELDIYLENIRRFRSTCSRNNNCTVIYLYSLSAVRT